MKIALISLAVLALTACGNEEDRKIAQAKAQQSKLAVLEEARTTAKINAEYNAQMYRAANPRFTADWNIVGRSDTTQTVDCPQGDGWASLSIMKVDGKQVDKVSLRCSTYSANVGCYREEDFVKDKALASEDGTCSRALSAPLPVLKK